MKTSVILSLLLACALQLTGCGGGGGGGGGTDAPPVQPPATIALSGVARKGPVSNAVVTVYAMAANGTAGAPLGSTTTDTSGNFTVNIPPESGPVLIEIRGNDAGTSTYVNDANPAAPPIRLSNAQTMTAAAIVGSSNISNTAVTPLTDMAVSYLRSFYDPAKFPTPPPDVQTAIIMANGKIGEIGRTFGINDITNPGDAGYTGFLPLFTQYMLNTTSATQPNPRTAAQAFITAATDSTAVAVLNKALTDAFDALPPAVKTTVAAPQAITPLTPPVFTTKATPAVVTLSTGGNLPGDSLIGAIDVSLVLPPGVTLSAKPSDINPAVLEPDQGVVVMKGAAAEAGNQVVATYLPGSPNKLNIKVISANGLTLGDFAGITVSVAAGVQPMPTDFTVVSNNGATTGISDLNTAPLLQVEVKRSAIGSGLGTIPQGATGSVTLAAVGTLPDGALIGAIDITVSLPVGVALKATPSSINPAVLVPDAGVVVPLGAAATAGSQMQATYVRGAPNKLVIRLVSPAGLPTGDFARVDFIAASGSNPAPTNFTVTPNSATASGVFDLNTGALPAISIGIN